MMQQAPLFHFPSSISLSLPLPLSRAAHTRNTRSSFCSLFRHDFGPIHISCLACMSDCYTVVRVLKPLKRNWINSRGKAQPHDWINCRSGDVIVAGANVNGIFFFIEYFLFWKRHCVALMMTIYVSPKIEFRETNNVRHIVSRYTDAPYTHRLAFCSHRKLKNVKINWINSVFRWMARRVIVCM